MEPQELSSALLQSQVIVVATLGELLATLPSLDDMTLFVSPSHLYCDLMDFANELLDSLYRIDGTRWRRNATFDDDETPASLSRALAAYKSISWTTRSRVQTDAWEWQRSVAALVKRWAQLARAATKLPNTCRDLATKAADMATTTTARARELQYKAARYWTAQENMVELGQALGGEERAEVVAGQEVQVRREAVEASSKATMATMVRQRLEVSLGLLERLMAAFDEATAFPWELQRLLKDIEPVLEGTNQASPNVPEALVAKVAMAERLWEANACLAKDHLVGTLQDIIDFLFHGAPTSRSACEVAERCQRAIEDIPRLLRPRECPQGVPKVSAVSMEPQELSPALLQPQVTVVATLDELLATLHRQAEMMLLLMSTVSLYQDLEDFTNDLQATLYRIGGTWWRCNVTVDDDDDPVTSNDDDPPASLSRALAAYKSTPGTTRLRVQMEASNWQWSVDTLVNRWARLARAATKLRNTCRVTVTEAGYRVATATARARELQDKAAHYGTAQENMVELNQALGGEEGAEVVARHEAHVSREARVAAREVTMVTMVRQRAEEALGLLERLVAACDEAAAFPRELQRLLWLSKATVKGTNEEFRDVPEGLVAKVAMAERLWVANARLVKHHLGKILPDSIKFLFSAGLDNPSTCGAAERCQRAMEDIPRLLQPPECPQGVRKMSPVSTELQELSPALLQPQVTVVATLGELLATLPRRAEEMVLRVSPLRLYWDLEEFTNELRTTLYRTDDTWWRDNVATMWRQCAIPVDDADHPASLSQALAAYKSTPGTPQNCVTMVASKWQESVSVLVDRWAELARKATELCNTCRDLATEAADRVATGTARERELQAEASCDGTAQENMVELGQALGGEEGAEVVAGYEAQVREEAMDTTSKARRATMVRQRVEAAPRLLEHLVAACDEANAFPRELQRRAGDIEAALKGTNEAAPNVPEDLVAKVAVAEWLWAANTRLVKHHLSGTLQDIIDRYFGCGPDSPRCRSVTEWCQRAIEDIPRLIEPLECPQSVPKVSPVSMELQELSPALLQPQVSVVAILGELQATLPSLDEMMLLLVSPSCLYWDLMDFTREFQTTLSRLDAAWWRRNVTSNDDDPPTSDVNDPPTSDDDDPLTSDDDDPVLSDDDDPVLSDDEPVLFDDDDPVLSDDDDPPASLSQALAAYKSTPWTSWDHVIRAASKWQGSVSVLVNSWTDLARKATKLPNTCRDLATKAANMATTATARARELQDKAARYWTAQENMVELGQALGGEEGAEVVARHEVQVRRDARVAASKARRATMVRQRVEASLGLLERLVAACDEATAFPRELQRLLRAIKAILKGTNQASHDVSEDLVAKVVMAERLWEANACLAKDHLVKTLPEIIKFLFTDGPARHSNCEVAKWCQRVIEDIPRLVRPRECPQGVPKVSAVSMELQKLSPALLQPQVTVVATLGELLATLPRWDEEMLLPMSLRCLYRDLEEFTEELQYRLYCTDNPWWHRSGTFDDDDLPISLSQALAAYKSTPWTSWKRVTVAASEWQGSVAELVDRWTQLARAATELGNTCREVANEASDMVVTATAQARELQDKAALDGTAQENMVELGQALAGEEGAEVLARQEAWVRRDAWVAASKATMATMVRQRVEASLGLLERLVAACDEAAAFPLELQRRVRDIKAALKGTNEAPTNVPEALVAKVAVAERLWEANACLVKDHLADTLCDIFNFAFDGGPFILCEVAKRCQRAFEDIPRLIRPPEDPCDVPKVFPVSMELQELTPALLQPQVTIVAILGELLATVPRWEKTLPLSLRCLYWVLEDFTRGLRPTLYCISDTWWCHNVTSGDDDPVTSLSQVLAASKSTPGTAQNCVTMAASKWKQSASVLVDNWAEVARKATKLRNTWREVATVAANLVTTTTARARELQAEVARYWTAQENMVELGQALGREEGAEVVAGHEAQVRRDARVAASEATKATKERQRVEASLGLLERLVAACDEATSFPRELQCRVGDIEAALQGTNEASCDVPEDLVAKVAVAERLWEANACLVKDHLAGTLQDIIDHYFGCGPDSPRYHRVAERCQRAIEDIPRLIRHLEHPQGVPKVSPVSMESQELSPALLQPQVTVVAILGELLATLPKLDKTLPVSPGRMYWDLEEFTNELQFTLHRSDDTWRRRNVTCDDDDPLTSLSRALAAYKSISWTTWDDVTMVASDWQQSVNALVNSWARLARAATKLCNAWREVVNEAATKVAGDTARAGDPQYEAACDGTAQENMVMLRQALGGEEGAEGVARQEDQVRRDARVAASEARTATMVRQQMEAALGLLERLVAACDEATAFPRELQRLLRDTKAILKGTNDVSGSVPEDLVAKVAVAEWLWEANTRLVNSHLRGTVPDSIIRFYIDGCPHSPSTCEVAEWCHRAIEDIPRLLQPSVCPQSIPKVSPVGMELQELSPALLQSQVTVVAILGELLATLPSRDEMTLLLTSSGCLYSGLMFFTWKLQDTRDCINDTLRHRNVLYDDDDPVPSLSQALAAYRSIPGTTQKSATMAASKWQGLVDVLVDRWAELARKATELHKTCREVATKADDEAATATARARKLQDKAARYGTAQGNMVEMGQALGGEEGAGVVAGHEAQVRRDARVAASEARRASTVRQRMEASLGLLERLVAACDEATAFPRELQRPLGDIKAILKGTNEASPDVPKDLVAKVAMAEQLWEANARLVKDHLGGTVRDIINCYFGFWPTSSSACEVAERCQRAIEDIPRLLRPPECPQSVPRVSPVSMEPQEVQQEGEEGRRDTGEDKGADGGCQQEQEADQGTEGQRGPLRGTGPLQEATSVTRSLTPPQLQALVAVVATLGEVVATVTGPHWAKSPNSLHEDLKNFTQSLRAILNHSAVTSRGHHGFPSLGRALATLRTTPGTTCADVRASVASTWRKFVAKIVDRWDWLAREATKLCEKVVMEQQLMVALDKEEVARELAMHDAEVAAATNEAMAEAVVATRWAMVATRRGHWAEVALGLLQHLVATCDRATLFNWNMEWWLRDIETTLKGTKEVSPDDPEALVFKVVKFQWLWDVSTRLAKDHLLGTLGDIDKILLSPCGDHGGPDGPGSRTVAKRCQRAVEDIPRLLQERFTWEQ